MIFVSCDILCHVIFVSCDILRHVICETFALSPADGFAGSEESVLGADGGHEEDTHVRRAT